MKCSWYENKYLRPFGFALVFREKKHPFEKMSMRKISIASNQIKINMTWRKDYLLSFRNPKCKIYDKMTRADYSVYAVQADGWKWLPFSDIIGKWSDIMVDNIENNNSFSDSVTETCSTQCNFIRIQPWRNHKIDCCANDASNLKKLFLFNFHFKTLFDFPSKVNRFLIFSCRFLSPHLINDVQRIPSTYACDRHWNPGHPTENRTLANSSVRTLN